MQIPSYENTLQVQTPTVPEPQVAKAVPGAFGEKVAEAGAQAGEKIGNVAQQLEDHIYQQKVWEQEANLYNSKEDLKSNIQDLLYSNDSVKIKDGKGNDVEVPKGYLNRSQFNAKGATDEYTQKSNALRESYLGQFTLPYMKKMAARNFDSIVSLGRNEVAAHEAKQIREGTANTFLSATQNEVKSAALASNPEDLKNSVESIKDAYLRYGAYKGMDPESIEKGSSKYISDAVHKSVTSNLLKNGDINQAQALLNSQQKNLAPDDYDNINKAIDLGIDKIQKAQEHAQLQQQIGNESDYLTKLSSGQLSWVNIDDISKDVRIGNVSEKFGAALTDVIKSDGKYQPKAEENENYPELIKGIYKAQDQTELQKGLLILLQDHKNISQDKFAVLINGAMERGKNLPLSIKQGDTKQLDPKQQEIDAGAMSILNYGRRNGLSDKDISDIYKNYNNAISEGKPVFQAIQSATNNQAIKSNPYLLHIPEGGKIMIDAEGNKAKVFPDGHIEEVNAKKESKPSVALQSK